MLMRTSMLAAALISLCVQSSQAQSSIEEDDRIKSSCLRLDDVQTSEALRKMMGSMIGLRVPVEIRNGSVKVDRSPFGGPAFVLEPLEHNAVGMEIRGGFPAGAPDNAVYKFIGKVTIQFSPGDPKDKRHVFVGDPSSPLTFVWLSNTENADGKLLQVGRGFTYLEGRGTATGDSGEVVQLPCVPKSTASASAPANSPTRKNQKQR